MALIASTTACKSARVSADSSRIAGPVRLEKRESMILGIHKDIAFAAPRARRDPCGKFALSRRLPNVPNRWEDKRQSRGCSVKCTSLFRRLGNISTEAERRISSPGRASPRLNATWKYGNNHTVIPVDRGAVDKKSDVLFEGGFHFVEQSEQAGKFGF